MFWDNAPTFRYSVKDRAKAKFWTTLKHTELNTINTESPCEFFHVVPEKQGPLHIDLAIIVAHLPSHMREFFTEIPLKNKRIREVITEVRIYRTF